MSKNNQATEIDYNSIEVLRADTQQITIPANMDLESLYNWVGRRLTDENQDVGIAHTIDALPLEGAHALASVLAEQFGWTSLTPKKSFWGDIPPHVVSVRTGPGKSVGVPWGRLVIPGIAGYLETGITWLRGRPALHVGGVIKRKHEPLVRKILDEATERCSKASLYHAHAIRMDFSETDSENPEDYQPEFLDLSDVDETQLVLPDFVRDMVESSVFAPVEQTEACREAGIPLKRGNLLAGPYGCGKTLTAKVLGKKCQRNGWTFMLVTNVAHLAQAVEMARRYQPCVIFAEDIDQALTGRQRDARVNEILNVIDGIESKSTEIMVVLTTNHAERINAAMLRPGRLDAVIPIGPPDASAAIRLVQRYCSGLLVTDEQALLGVGKRLAGQIPAVIREVCERSKLAAIAGHGSAEQILPEDLLVAAEGMREQMNLLTPEPPDDRSEMERAADLMGQHIVQAAGKVLNGHNPLPKGDDQATVLHKGAQPTL